MTSGTRDAANVSWILWVGCFGLEVTNLLICTGEDCPKLWVAVNREFYDQRGSTTLHTSHYGLNFSPRRNWWLAKCYSVLYTCDHTDNHGCQKTDKSGAAHRIVRFPAMGCEAVLPCKTIWYPLLKLLNCHMHISKLCRCRTICRLTGQYFLMSSPKLRICNNTGSPNIVHKKLWMFLHNVCSQSFPKV